MQTRNKKCQLTNQLELELKRGHWEFIELLCNPSERFEAKDTSTKKLLTKNNVNCPAQILTETFIKDNSEKQITACYIVQSRPRKIQKIFG